MLAASSILLVLLLLGPTIVWSADCDENDLRGLVAVLVEQTNQLQQELSQIRNAYDTLQQDSVQLQQKHATHERKYARWQREINKKINSWVGGGRRHLSNATSTRRRGLSSSSTCSDASSPQLLVEGVCSCTGGLLVAGRNVTEELDAATIASTTPETTTTTPTECGVAVQSGVMSSDFINTPHTANIALSPDAKHVFVTGFGSDSLAIVNVTDPTNPTIVGSIVDDTLLLGPGEVVVSPDGNYAFVAVYYTHSVVVVDVATNISQPTVVGQIRDSTQLTYAWVLGLSPDGTRLYVGGYHDGNFAVVDISTPTDPLVLGSTSATSMTEAYGLAVSPNGALALVTGSGVNTLNVLNITVPTAPVMIGTLVGNGTAMYHPVGVKFSQDGRTAYVSGYVGLTVVDIATDPMNPTMLSHFGISGALAHGVDLSPSGQYVYMAMKQHVAVIEVLDNHNPTLVGLAAANTSALTGPFGLAAAPNETVCYVTGKGSHSLAIVRLSCEVS